MINQEAGIYLIRSCGQEWVGRIHYDADGRAWIQRHGTIGLVPVALMDGEVVRRLFSPSKTHTGGEKIVQPVASCDYWCKSPTGKHGQWQACHVYADQAGDLRTMIVGQEKSRDTNEFVFSEI